MTARSDRREPGAPARIDTPVRRRAGRPRMAIAANAAQEIERLAREGATLAYTAATLGVSIRTLHRWMNERDDLKDARERGHARAEKELYDVLWAKAMNGDTVALLFIAKCRFGWREQGDAHDSARPSVVINLPAAMSPEQYMRTITVEAETK